MNYKYTDRDGNVLKFDLPIRIVEKLYKIALTEGYKDHRSSHIWKFIDWRIRDNSISHIVPKPEPKIEEDDLRELDED